MSIEQLAGAWLWDKYGKALTDKAFGALKSKWDQVRWLDAAERYRSHVKDLHSRMRVVYKDETVELDDLYVDLFVIDKKTAQRRYGVESLQILDEDKSIFKDQSKRISALRVVTQHDRLFIFGKPGIGKTTLLKYLAIQSAKKKIDKVPIYISFYAWSYSGKDLISYISDQFEICGFPNPQNFIEALLSRGDAILLFDGLDEVSEEDDAQIHIIRETEDFINRHKNNSVCITCRNSGSNYRFEKFTYVEIADFTIEQVQKFTSKWFSHNPEKGWQFIEQLHQHRNLFELSQNPLLLGLLCLIFDEYSRFPEKRFEIYRDSVDALITRWDNQRGIRRDEVFKGFTPAVEKELLSLLALEYSLWGKFFFEEDDLAEKIIKYLENSSFDSKSLDGRKIVRAIEVQHGLLVKRIHRIYSFPHLTFQEYFAANCILNNQTDQVIETIARNILTPHWGEIIQLVSSLLPEGDLFFFKLIRTTNKFVNNFSSAKQTDITKWIEQIASFIPNQKTNIVKARKEAIATIIITENILTEIKRLASECERIILNDIDRIKGDDNGFYDFGDEYITELLSEIADDERSKYKISSELQSFVRRFYNQKFQYADIRKYLKSTCKILDDGIINNVCKKIQDTFSRGYAFNLLSKIRPAFVSQTMDAIRNNHSPICFSNDEEQSELITAFLQAVIDNRITAQKGQIGAPTENLERLLKVNTVIESCLKQANIKNINSIEEQLFVYSKV